MTRLAFLVVALLGLAPAATPSGAASLAAQTGEPSATRGWIGFAYETGTRQDASGRPSSWIVVTDVVEGSPADLAGFRPGDRLVRVNQRRATPDYFRQVARRLQPGQRVALTMERGGQRWDVTLRAAPAPQQGYVAVPNEFVFRVDSTFQRLDSLRIRLRAADGLVLDSTLEGRIVASVREWRTADGKTVDVNATLDRVADSLRPRIRTMIRLRPDESRTGFLVRTDSVQRGWFRALTDSGAVDLPEPGAEGRPFSMFFFRNDEADTLNAVERRGSDVAERVFLTWADTIRADSAGRRWSHVVAESRPLLPYIAGRNRVAGAEFTPLNPGLAEYFDVAEGLLVTDVTAGTPADDAGLRPGDVVLRVDELVVTDLMQLRTAVARASGSPIRLHLVRKGERLEIELGR